MLKRLFVVIQGEHFLVSSNIATVMEVLLHSKILSVRNVESILLFSLPYIIKYSLYVIFFHDKYFAKELQGNAVCLTNTLHRCTKTAFSLLF